MNIELHREISTHESDLVEIVEDNPDDVEEEVITVEYMNLTSKRRCLKIYSSKTCQAEKMIVFWL